MKPNVDDNNIWSLFVLVYARYLLVPGKSLEELAELYLVREGSRGYLCSLCGKVTRDRYGAVDHLECKHFPTYGGYHCDICGKTYTENKNLTIHKRNHTGEKPYKCDICDFKTGVKNKLTIHIKSKHTKEPFQCRHCDFITDSDKKLRTHVTMIHGPNRKNKIILAK